MTPVWLRMRHPFGPSRSPAQVAQETDQENGTVSNTQITYLTVYGCLGRGARVALGHEAEDVDVKRHEVTK